MIKRLRIWIYQKFGVGMDETEYLMNDKRLMKTIEEDKGDSIKEIRISKKQMNKYEKLIKERIKSEIKAPAVKSDQQQIKRKEEFLRLKKSIKELAIKDIRQTCHWRPAQWEIDLESGHMLYVRYRWGYLTITKSIQPTNDVGMAIDGEEIFCRKIGGDWDGEISEKKMLRYLKKCL